MKRLGEQAMMRLRRASTIAAFFLLVWATTAGAECAWILWGTAQNAQHEPIGELYTAGAFDTRAECRKAAESLANAMPRPKNWAADAPMWGYVQCLPDTVDPRGPKSAPR
jgi:hypothetical protein